MKILLVYLVSVMLVLCWSEAQIANLDHLQLVNVWSPTFCSTTNCQPNIPNNFYLHGLLPANRNGGLISGCPDTPGVTQAVEVSSLLESILLRTMLMRPPTVIPLFSTITEFSPDLASTPVVRAQVGVFTPLPDVALFEGSVSSRDEPHMLALVPYTGDQVWTSVEASASRDPVMASGLIIDPPTVPVPEAASNAPIVTEIRDNRRQLDAHWRSLKAGQTGDRLWQDEWTKHGPCTGLTPDNYLKTATTQQSNLNLLKVFNDAGIIPSNARTVTEANIVAAIRRKTANNNVYISCHSINNVFYLKEIVICLTRTGTNYHPCPATGSPRNCGANIIIPTSIDLDHLQLVNVWAPTFCSRNRCKSRFDTNFYLHGLWPANRNGRLISGCPDTPGVTQAIANNRRQLDVHWRSLKAGETGDYLWLHEWTKHGPCTGLTPDNYFKTATTQQSKINLLRALNDDGIVPSNARTVTKANIVAAIRKKTANNNVYISCQSINNVNYLKEIHICLTKTGNEYYNCPATGGPRNCGTNIIIPSSIPRGTVDVAAI